MITRSVFDPSTYSTRGSRCGGSRVRRPPGVGISGCSTFGCWPWVPLVLLGLAACDGGPAPPVGQSPAVPELPAAPEPPAERVFVDAGWTQVWSRVEEDDSLLAQPALLTPTTDGFFLFDDFDGRVLAYDREGRLRWTFGQKGEGPEEFGRAQALRVDAEGGLHILDRDNLKVVRLSPGGRLEDTRTLPQRAWQSMVLLAGGDYLFESLGAGWPFHRLSEGRPVVSDSVALSWDRFWELTVLQREGHLLVGLPGDPRWIYAFTLADAWFPFRGTRSVGYRGRNVESTPTPEVRQYSGKRRRRESLSGQPIAAAVGGWIAGDTVQIHFGGITEDRYAVIDRYDFETGSYLNSLRLPSPANEVTRVGDLYLLLTRHPWPRVQAWRIASTAGLVDAGSGP